MALPVPLSRKIWTQQPADCSTVEATLPDNDYVFKYKRYYVGAGKIEAFNNPGLKSPPNSGFLPGTLTTCDAAAQCAQLTRNQAGGFLSFDLHKRKSTELWECVQYYGPNTDASYFSEEDADVGVVLGYSYDST